MPRAGPLGLSLLAGFALLACCARAARPAPARPEEGLVGAWRLVSYEDFDQSGVVRHPYGEHPRGLFIYDAAGNVSIQLSREERPECSVRRASCTPEQEQELLRSYSAYFGRYRVDAERGVVIHEVEASLHPDFLGGGPRRFRLEGDQLILGDGVRWRRVLRRVK